MNILGGIFGGLAQGLVSGGLNFFSQRSTNRANQRMSEEQMRFQAAQADATRHFNRQERELAQEYATEMSNTAHQRAMKDLQAAGLHPSLAAGGASSPQVAGATSPTPAGAKADFVAPKIHLPDMFAMYMSMRQLELQEKRLGIEGEKAAADITKKLSDKDLNKMKEVLLKRGMPRAEIEGEAHKLLKQILKMIREDTLTPKVDGSMRDLDVFR